MTILQLINAGYEIKASSVLEYGGVIEHHIYLQNSTDAYVAILKRRSSDGASLTPQPQIIRLG